MTLAISKEIKGTATELAAANPTAPLGDRFRETDTRAVKIADGTTAYNSLGYGSSAIGFADLATDFSTTSASYVDVLTLTYTPLTDKALVTVTGAISNSTSGANYFQVLCSNAATGKIGNAQPFDATGRDVAVAGMSKFTSLTPGTSYTFKIQVKVSGGTCNIRAAAFPDNEHISIKGESL